MPHRTQALIRRGINRLYNTLLRNKDAYPVLAAILAIVAEHMNRVNESWQEFQSKAVAGDKERAERETAVGRLVSWIQQWRPVVLLLVPGASDNIRNLPSGATTSDDVARVAEDLVTFIKTNDSAASFRESALNDLGDDVEAVKKETKDAAAALPAEAAARERYSDACVAANTVLVKGTEVIRSIFGRTSPEYKQFIQRESGEEEEETSESVLGEE